MATLGTRPLAGLTDSPLKTEMPVNSGLQLYIFSKHLQFLDYTGMSEAAREMGFDGIDLTVRPKDAVRSNVANATALKREGSAEEVADTVAYLASSESSFLTGVNLDINGGLYYS